MESRDIYQLLLATQWLVSCILVRPWLSKRQASYLTGGNDSAPYYSTGPDTLLLYRYLGLVVGIWSVNFQQTPSWFLCNYSPVHTCLICPSKEGKIPPETWREFKLCKGNLQSYKFPGTESINVQYHEPDCPLSVRFLLQHFKKLCNCQNILK